MKKNLLSINEMLGGTWRYRGKEYKFQAFKKNEEAYILATDIEWFEFESGFQLDCFLADCQPVTSNLPENRQSSGLSLPDAKSDEVMAMLKGILVENIKKVNEDKSFVAQAQTVSKNVQALVNLTRLEMDIKVRMNNQ